MNRTTLLWVMVLFFGSSLAFAGLRRLTEGQPAGVIAAVQIAALLAFLAGIAIVVRRLRD